MLKILFKSLTIFLVGFFRAQGMELHPEVVAAVKQYFFGDGTDRKLPVQYHGETLEAIVLSLKHKWDYPGWEGLNTANFDHLSRPAWHWFTTLEGVVGAFNYSAVPSEEGVWFHCEDLWDFNVGENSTTIELPTLSDKLKKGVLKAANLLGIKVEEKENGSLKVHEETLATLNQGRQFYTRWEVFISWSDLETSIPGCQEGMSFQHPGLPKSWLREVALNNAVNAGVPQGYRLKQINSEEGYFTIAPRRNRKDIQTFPFTWEGIEVMKMQ